MNSLWEEWDNDERDVFRKWLGEHLRYGEVKVTFIKKDGELRSMRCTLNSEQVPQVEKKTDRVKEVSEEVCPVYDLDKQGWRSFRYDSVKEVLIEIDGTES